MKAKDIMTTSVLTAKPTDTLSATASILITRRFNGLPVVDDENRVVGMVAERDFLVPDTQLYLPTYIKMLQDFDFVKNDKKRLPDDVRAVMNAKVEDVMVKDVVVAHPDDDLNDLAVIFATKRVNPVPIVDEQNKLIGIIARSDLIKLFVKENIE